MPASHEIQPHLMMMYDLHASSELVFLENVVCRSLTGIIRDLSLHLYHQVIEAVNILYCKACACSNDVGLH